MLSVLGAGAKGTEGVDTEPWELTVVTAVAAASVGTAECVPIETEEKFVPWAGTTNITATVAARRAYIAYL
jgi:hypothetical protein